MSNSKDKIIFSNAAHIHIFIFMTDFFAMFSEFSETFENAVNGLTTSFFGKKIKNKESSLSNFFTADMEKMGDAVLVQLGDKDYASLYIELAQSTINFEELQTLVDEIKLMFPSLPPLDESLSSNTLLAYTAVCKTKSKEKKALDKFLSYFKEVFDKIEADSQKDRAK